MRLLLITSISIAFCGIQLTAQTAEEPKKSFADKFELHGYGEMTFNVFDWDTYPDKRNNIDLNRIVFEPEYAFSEKVKLEMEIEFEHGGTGATMEFDKFEEFGEFEMEIEKGGEVIIEELEIAWQVKPWLEFKAGRIAVPVGHIAAYGEPLEYMTSTYNNMEANLIPAAWYENGIGAEVEWKKIAFELAIINGLDNSAFSSANWIQRGNQTRFEYVNTEAFALAARLDYAINDDIVFGVSSYSGNSTPNRPKPDINANGVVQLVDAHLHAQVAAFTFNAMFLSGTLQNAATISEANRNLSNNLNVKRTPIASAVLGYFAEAGYNVLSCLEKDMHRLDVFAGYYYYDSMYKTSGEIFNNPRWERSEIRTGLNYCWNKNIAIKSDYTFRTIGIPDLNKENTFTLALAYHF